MAGSGPASDPVGSQAACRQSQEGQEDRDSPEHTRFVGQDGQTDERWVGFGRTCWNQHGKRQVTDRGRGLQPRSKIGSVPKAEN